MVRRAQARDYCRHIEGYVLARLGDLPVADLSPRDILGLRVELLQSGLSLKFVKNILGASFKAMIRDAREIDNVPLHDPFAGVRWGGVAVPGPDPFAAEERMRIIELFRKKPFGFYSGGSGGKHLHVHLWVRIIAPALRIKHLTRLPTQVEGDSERGLGGGLHHQREGHEAA